MATSAEKAALRPKKITASEGATFARSTGYSVFATSGGFVGRHAGSSQHVVAQVIADDPVLPHGPTVPTASHPAST